jgi:hypothetical protein
MMISYFDEISTLILYVSKIFVVVLSSESYLISFKRKRKKIIFEISLMHLI